jgi:hypothetical protein
MTWSLGCSRAQPYLYAALSIAPILNLNLAKRFNKTQGADINYSRNDIFIQSSIRSWSIIQDNQTKFQQSHFPDTTPSNAMLQFCPLQRYPDLIERKSINA